MSRIDEALRRTEGAAGATTLSTTRVHGDGEVIESPLSLFRPAGEVARATVKAVPQEVKAPVAEHFVSEGPFRSAGAQLTAQLASRWKGRLVVSPEADWVLVEQFRRLAATLHQTQSAGNLKIVMVTSATPGDGKTLSAINLALTLSESYARRVLLIDADLREPSIRNLWDVPEAGGLTEALKAPADEKLTVFPVSDKLTLLPAGRPDPNPMSGLTSARMQRILREAGERFDWVIVDAPPVGTLADANLLSAMVDGALLVIRAGTTKSTAVTKAIEALGRERILGVVLNSVEGVDEREYRSYATSSREALLSRDQA